MGKYMRHIALIGVFILISTGTALAQNQIDASEFISLDSIVPQTFLKGKIIEVMEEGTRDIAGQQNIYQRVRVKTEKEEHELEHGGIWTITEDQKVKRGDRVVLTQSVDGTLTIFDKYRLPPLIWIFAIFFGLAIFFGRRKGFMSILGLLVSIGIIAKLIIPWILAGGNPITVSLTGSILIAAIAFFIGHGFHARTTIALASTLVTLILAAMLAWIFVNLTKLTGMGSEDAMFLQLGFETINLKGLLLGGIMIGALGVLDDITTAQSAVVDELKKANKKLCAHDLYQRAISIGKEHTASLVNTLALAYAGAALPLFLLFARGTETPFWVTLNSEFIVEEIVRTLVGSRALILAVPITTYIAAYYFAKHPSKESANEHCHQH